MQLCQLKIYILNGLLRAARWGGSGESQINKEHRAERGGRYRRWMLKTCHDVRHTSACQVRQYVSKVYGRDYELEKYGPPSYHSTIDGVGIGKVQREQDQQDQQEQRAVQ